MQRGLWRGEATFIVFLSTHTVHCFDPWLWVMRVVIGIGTGSGESGAAVGLGVGLGLGSEWNRRKAARLGPVHRSGVLRAVRCSLM